ncbi:uncharacterized protein G2W53_001017 [Senna tora]|uniref:Retrotransposon gag domain-containing protein n=1 Tax=Senna tora TaxID=362788 RepID=A0A835CM70_9FABA|nr:uncharacterized protein G2W53_001017 [Senna tora]
MADKSSDSNGAVKAIVATNPFYRKDPLSMRMVLKSKKKLGFIDGTSAWMVNAMTKELAEVFLIRRKISSIQQGSDTLVAYSNKLKKLWEQLNCLRPRRKCIYKGCTCGASQELTQSVASDNLLEFLNGLNNSYENVVNNILMMDPQPSHNKTYSIIATLEEQKSLTTVTKNVVKASALAMKLLDQQNSNIAGFKNYSKKEDKKNRYCNFCKKTGHLQDACFKKNGYLEWFKAFKEKKGQNMVNNVSGSQSEESEAD